MFQGLRFGDYWPSPYRCRVAKKLQFYHISKSTDLSMDLRSNSNQFVIFFFPKKGTPKCQPEIRCRSIQLHGEDGEECEDSYLEISDGWGGNHRVCGKSSLDKRGVRASYTQNIILVYK